MNDHFSESFLILDSPTRGIGVGNSTTKQSSYSGIGTRSTQHGTPTRNLIDNISLQNSPAYLNILTPNHNQHLNNGHHHNQHLSNHHHNNHHNPLNSPVNNLFDDTFYNPLQSPISCLVDPLLDWGNNRINSSVRLVNNIHHHPTTTTTSTTAAQPHINSNHIIIQPQQSSLKQTTPSPPPQHQPHFHSQFLKSPSHFDSPLKTATSNSAYQYYAKSTFQHSSPDRNNNSNNNNNNNKNKNKLKSNTTNNNNNNNTSLSSNEILESDISTINDVVFSNSNQIPILNQNLDLKLLYKSEFLPPLPISTIEMIDNDGASTTTTTFIINQSDSDLDKDQIQKNYDDKISKASLYKLLKILIYESSSIGDEQEDNNNAIIDNHHPNNHVTPIILPSIPPKHIDEINFKPEKKQIHSSSDFDSLIRQQNNIGKSKSNNNNIKPTTTDNLLKNHLSFYKNNVKKSFIQNFKKRKERFSERLEILNSIIGNNKIDQN